MKKIKTKSFEGYEGTIKIFSPYPEAIQELIKNIQKEIGGSICKGPNDYDGKEYDLTLYTLPSDHSFNGINSKPLKLKINISSDIINDEKYIEMLTEKISKSIENG